MDKWEKLYKWVTDNHYDVIRKQRIAIKNGVPVHIKDDEEIMNVLDKMQELEKEQYHEEYLEKIKRMKERTGK